MRIADDFGCATIGIQYQQGLKDLLPASDLVEGTLNNADRPPVKSRDGKRVLYEGEPLPHFNEVDECAGLDALMTYRVHKAMGQPVENTLHDLRWGDLDRSGTVDRLRLGLSDQRLGAAGAFHRRLGRRIAASGSRRCISASAAARSRASASRARSSGVANLHRGRRTENGSRPRRRGRAAAGRNPAPLEATTPQWPIMHAVTYGVSRDQMMARHKANHIQVAYANSAGEADRAMSGQSGDGGGAGDEAFPSAARVKTEKAGKPLRLSRSFVLSYAGLVAALPSARLNNRCRRTSASKR